MSLSPLLQSLRFLAGDEPLPSAVFVDRPVNCWDPYLDLDLPLVIGANADLESALQGLLEAGMSQETPLRWVDAQGRVREEHWAQAQALVVGWTHANEGWRERLPLFGRKLVLTRAADKLPGLALQLEELGAIPVNYPVLGFEGIHPELPQLEEFDWVLFTSPNGVRFFWDLLRRQDLDARVLGRARLGCIGPSTGKELLRFGLRADLVPPQFVAESFLNSLTDFGIAGNRILIPRAEEAREVLPEGLREQGATVEVLPVYRTFNPAAALELPKDCEAALFTSSSTVRHFVQSSGRRLPAACIGPVTAATAEEHDLPVLCVAEEHTVQGLLKALVHHFEHR